VAVSYLFQFTLNLLRPLSDDINKSPEALSALRVRVWSFMIGSSQGINGVILPLLTDHRFVRHKRAQLFYIELGQRPSVTNHSFAASIPLGRRIWQKIEFG
jgi:hypothetical protein